MKKSLLLLTLLPALAHAEVSIPQCATLLRDTLTVLAYSQTCQVDDEAQQKQILMHIRLAKESELEAEFAQCKALSERSNLAQQQQLWQIVQQPNDLTEQISHLAQQTESERQTQCRVLAAQWATHWATTQ